MPTSIATNLSKGKRIIKKFPTLTLAILFCLSVFVGFTPQKTSEDSNILEPPKNVIDNYDNKNEIEVEIGGNNESNENSENDNNNKTNLLNDF